MDYKKHLRQRIVATAYTKHGWSVDKLHNYMNDWNFGSSLRKLSVSQLQQLLDIVKGTEKPSSNYIELDSRGKFMWHLMKKAGWNLPKLKAFWKSKFRKANYSDLSPNEVGATTRMLQNYIDKGINDETKQQKS